MFSPPSKRCHLLYKRPQTKSNSDPGTFASKYESCSGRFGIRAQIFKNYLRAHELGLHSRLDENEKIRRLDQLRPLESDADALLAKPDRDALAYAMKIFESH